MTRSNIQEIQNILQVLNDTIFDWGNAHTFLFNISTYKDTVQLDIDSTSSDGGREEDIADWIDDVTAYLKSNNFDAISSKGRILIAIKREFQ